MKGIILAAGKGTRLYPMTYPVCKPLLPVYDKPMIYYPLCALMQAGIRDILIITPPGDDRDDFEQLLHDGSQFGIKISYEVQYVARGIADALILGEKFLDGDNCCLALGDNIFYSPTFHLQLQEAVKSVEEQGKAAILGYYVDDPRPFGVVEFDKTGKVISLEEKPRMPRSNYIVPGLYFYDSKCCEMAKTLSPSARGELEITDLNRLYMNEGNLNVILLDRNFTWLDAGTAENLLEAAQTVHEIQRGDRKYVGCPEQVALYNDYITSEQCYALGEAMKKTGYGRYLLWLAKPEMF